MQNKTEEISELVVKDIPVILVHKGNQEYLKICLDYATNHGHKIILIGDKTNKEFVLSDNIWIDSNELVSDELKQFDKAYVHMNTNPYEYEKFCFERHFLIYEYIRKSNIDRFFMMDSDVLLGESELTEKFFSKELNKYDAGLCWLEDYGDMSWSVSPHFSYWTYESLNSFIKYILEIYYDNMQLIEIKYKWHLDNNILGGICDMTLLYLWIKNNNVNVLNFCSKDNKKYGIDNCVRCKNDVRYKKKGAFESIVFKAKTPYYILEDNKDEVQAFVIHAQGSSKKYMKILSEGKFSRITRVICILKNIL